MGFLNLFSRSGPAGVQRLPSGSMTIDRHGRIITSTVPSSYPTAILSEIAQEVLRLFREARNAQMPLSEFKIHLASLQITARDLHGGAIVFLSPNVSYTVSTAN